MPAAPVVTIVTPTGPSLPARDVFLQWAQSVSKTKSDADNRAYQALAQLPIWERQAGRVFYQMMPGDSVICPERNCSALLNRLTRPSALAVCALPGDFHG